MGQTGGLQEAGAGSQKRSLCAKPRNLNSLLKAVKSYYRFGGGGCHILGLRALHSCVQGRAAQGAGREPPQDIRLRTGEERQVWTQSADAREGG